MDAFILFFLDIVDRITDFMELGGDVLMIIAFVIFVMWLLIFERLVYFSVSFPKLSRQVQDAWNARTDHRSWRAHQIRSGMVSAVSLDAKANLETIKTLVALCPLLGLLGTVTGMISVFDVMAVSGMGNPRLMASGVSKATIPTMSGMVGALSGVFAINWLDSLARTRIEILSDHLETEHEVRHA